jgi:hypothetical protein
MTLDEYSADGLTLVSANVFSHSFNIPTEATLTADPDVFPAFRVRNGLRLINAVDDFGFVGTPIPEPASVAMIGLAAAGLLLAKRENRSA